MNYEENDRFRVIGVLGWENAKVRVISVSGTKAKVVDVADGVELYVKIKNLVNVLQKRKVYYTIKTLGMPFRQNSRKQIKVYTFDDGINHSSLLNIATMSCALGVDNVPLIENELRVLGYMKGEYELELI